VAVGQERDDDLAERLVDPDDGLRDLAAEIVPEAPAGMDAVGRGGVDRVAGDRVRGGRGGHELGVHAQALAASRRRTAGRIPPCSK
jgi:hypothetical protein